MEHRAQVAVECPQCHWRHFMEVDFDQKYLDSELGRLIHAQLEAWIASRCPDHLGPILKLSKN